MSQSSAIPPSDAPTTPMSPGIPVGIPPGTTSAGSGPIQGLGLLTPGMTFANHRLERILGQGGMGMVWFGRHLVLDRPAAIKVRLGAADDRVGRERFLREARTSAQVRHPHVIGIHDAGVVDGIEYLAMDYVDGGSLADRIRRHPGGLPVVDVLRFAQAAARGLGAIHGLGLVHRDLKPANLLLGEEDRLIIADFGLARPPEVSQDLTAGRIVGTPRFLAPELIQGQPGDARSDLYALGVTLFEALTGRPLFQADTHLQLYHQITTAALPLVHDLRPEVPTALSRLVAELLERDPARRPASAQVLLGRLVELAAPAVGPGAGPAISLTTVGGGELPPAPPMARPTWVISASVAAGVLLVGGTIWWGRTPTVPPAPATVAPKVVAPVVTTASPPAPSPVVPAPAVTPDAGPTVEPSASAIPRPETPVSAVTEPRSAPAPIATPVVAPVVANPPVPPASIPAVTPVPTPIPAVSPRPVAEKPREAEPVAPIRPAPRPAAAVSAGPAKVTSNGDPFANDYLATGWRCRFATPWEGIYADEGHLVAWGAEGVAVSDDQGATWSDPVPSWDGGPVPISEAVYAGGVCWVRTTEGSLRQLGGRAMNRALGLGAATRIAPCGGGVLAVENGGSQVVLLVGGARGPASKGRLVATLEGGAIVAEGNRVVWLGTAGVGGDAEVSKVGRPPIASGPPGNYALTREGEVWHLEDNRPALRGRLSITVTSLGHGRGPGNAEGVGVARDPARGQVLIGINQGGGVAGLDLDGRLPEGLVMLTSCGRDHLAGVRTRLVAVGPGGLWIHRIR